MPMQLELGEWAGGEGKGLRSERSRRVRSRKTLLPVLNQSLWLPVESGWKLVVGGDRQT